MIPRLGLSLLTAVSLSTPALAEPEWLAPKDFEARVTGMATQVFDTYGDLFGTEYFLPGRDVIWQYAGSDDCLQGSWKPRRGAICYTYADGSTNCLRYYPDGNGLVGVEWDDGAPSGDTYRLKLTAAPPPACPTS